MASEKSAQKIPAAVGPYRVAVSSGGFVFTSGQIGLHPETGSLVDGTIEGQTKQVMENLKAVLESEGLGLEKIIKTTIYLTRMEDFATVNQIYGGYFKSVFPARSTIAVAALPKGALVEIDAIATKQ